MGKKPGPKKGTPKAPGSGRVKGTPNKTTALLKDAILKGAESAGSDGKGKDGLVGYLKEHATKTPAAFMALLGKVLPLQLTGEGGGAIKTEGSITADDAVKIIKEFHNALKK